MVGQFRHTILYELENIIEEYDLDLKSRGSVTSFRRSETLAIYFLM